MKTRPQTRSLVNRVDHSTIEILEDRIAPAVFVVTNATDTHVTGKVDLREALAMADAAQALHPGKVNTILFHLA